MLSVEVRNRNKGQSSCIGPRFACCIGSQTYLHGVYAYSKRHTIVDLPYNFYVSPDHSVNEIFFYHVLFNIGLYTWHHVILFFVRRVAL